MSNLKTHSEKNIDVAAFLRAAGLPVVRVNASNPRNLVWEFAQPKRCQKLVEQFFQGTALTNPQVLLFEFKRLKDQIFDTRRRSEEYDDGGRN